jgi:hypothetical protein
LLASLAQLSNKGVIMAWKLTFKLEDAYGRKTRKTFDIVAASHVAAEAVRDAFIIDFAAVTGCDVLASVLSEETAYSDSVTAGANLDAGAIYQFKNSSNQGMSTRIPAPIAATLTSGGQIDTTDSDVINFVANFTGGDVLLSDGEVVASSHGGYLER